MRTPTVHDGSKQEEVSVKNVKDDQLMNEIVKTLIYEELEKKLVNEEITKTFMNEKREEKQRVKAGYMVGMQMSEK